MKIICDKAKLIEASNIALRAISNKTTMPILNCIIIDVKDNIIKFTSNNLEIGIETVIDGEILEEGSIAINAKKLSETFKKIPSESITLSTDPNNILYFECKKSNGNSFKLHLNGMDTAEYSYLPNIEKKHPIVISQFSLKEIIQQTVFSTADNNVNKMLSGELMEIKDNTLRLVALDNNRIAIRKIKLNDSYPDLSVIIPAKTLSEISKTLSGNLNDFVNIYVTESSILFEFDSTIFLSRLMEGEFFPIDKMLSSDYETKITLNKMDLLNGIDCSTLLTKESEKQPVILCAKDNTMSIAINSADGAMTDIIDVEKEGKDIMIGFNPKFIMDALRVIEDEDITMYMINPKAPCFIKDKEESYIYLILPVNF